MIGRTSSMGKLDPMGGGRSSGSQPCLMVAQTVSNRRKRHAAQETQKAMTVSSVPGSGSGQGKVKISENKYIIPMVNKYYLNEVTLRRQNLF